MSYWLPKLREFGIEMFGDLRPPYVPYQNLHRNSWLAGDPLVKNTSLPVLYMEMRSTPWTAPQSGREAGLFFKQSMFWV